jgi:magnesium-transporting ATPase (P-type)
MLPQLIAVGVGFAFIHYSVLGWDLGRTVTIGLYVTLAIMVLGLLISSLVSYIRAPPVYWAVVIVMVIAMYVVFLARPNTMRLIVPLMGLLEYMKGGGLENLLAPLALYLVSTAILYPLISYRR